MKIVHAASELFPYIKTGGLADAVGALTSTLADGGHAVSVFLPGYRRVCEHPDAALARRVLSLRIEMGDGFMSGHVLHFSPRPNLDIYLICREEFFDRAGPYGNGERDYEDNFLRFVFFGKGVVEVVRLLDLQPDILHCHDWQTGLLPLLLRHAEQLHGLMLAAKTVFTIHNIAYQGVFPMRGFPQTNLPEELMGIDGVEFYAQLSMMKAGILFADRITTVSPRYAEEIQTSEFGCALDGVVATRIDDLVGLLNGIDTAIWNPATDASLPARYSASDLAGKRACRSELLKRAGWSTQFAGPVFGMVCRLTEQKGVDLVLANEDFFQEHDCRLVILGAGDVEIQTALRDMERRLNGRLVLSTRLDEDMCHLIEAGSDFFLMPSRFEPCGLNQMYSQAYGTVPLVSMVGGLVDTVIDADMRPKEGTGLCFPATADGLRHGLERALELFADKARMQGVLVRGMQKDFSWRKAAKAYEAFYGATF